MQTNYTTNKIQNICTYVATNSQYHAPIMSFDCCSMPLSAYQHFYKIDRDHFRLLHTKVYEYYRIFQYFLVLDKIPLLMYLQTKQKEYTIVTIIIVYLLVQLTKRLLQCVCINSEIECLYIEISALTKQILYTAIL